MGHIVTTLLTTYITNTLNRSHLSTRNILETKEDPGLYLHKAGS